MIVILILTLSIAFQSWAQQTATNTGNTETQATVPQIKHPDDVIVIDLPNLPGNAKPLEMVLVKSGTFTMGSPLDERGRHDWEWPSHQVTITKNFYLGKYEVTQAQWMAVMGTNPAEEHGLGPNYPVYFVSWNECQAFLQRLNQSGEGLFRLPTEAEWEFACRAGTRTRYSHGDVMECGDVCERCEEHERYMWWCGNNSPSGAKEVGLKQPNPWGLYDMHGNVYEWCKDWWGPPFARGAAVDPQGPTTGTFRVLKGGGWAYDSLGCRSAFRYGYTPENQRSYDGFGFRLLREISAQPE